MAHKNGNGGKKSNGKPIGKSRNGAKGTTGNGYNWAQIGAMWLKSQPINGAEFCRIHNIPYSTAKCHIKFSDIPDDPLAEARAEAAEFRRRLDVEVLSATREYVKHMKRAAMVIGEITDTAAADFIQASRSGQKYNSTGEPGRLAVQAAKSLIDIGLEIDAIPDDNETDGWPLTRGFRPFDYQRDFIFDTPTELKRRGQDVFIQAFIAGIGSGKTRCGAEKLGDVAWMNRGSTIGVFAPTYRMLEDATKAMVFEVLHTKGISYKYRKTDNSIILFGDTRIIFRSMDDPDHLRGPNLAAAWIDEGGQMKTREAFDVIMGRVRDIKATCRSVWITTTPKGLGWLYDICIEMPEKHKVKLYTGSTQQNIALPPEYYTGLLDIYDPKLAQQELQGAFINVFQGQMYWNFKRRTNSFKSAKSPFRYDPNHPMILTCDFNVSPMCWNIIQNHDGIDIVLDEIHIDTASTQVAIEEFVERYHGHKAEIFVYGDAVHGRQRRTSATRTDFEIIERGLKGNNARKRKFPRIDIRIGKTNPAITDRIAAVNARFRTASGKRLLFFVAESNKYSIMDCEKCGFIPGTRQPDESDKTIGHHMSAVGYYCEWEYPVFGARVTHGRKRQ